MRRKKLSHDAAANARIEAAHKEAQKALKENRCPVCGRGVRRNLSLTGWVQCEQLGTEQFRKYPNLAPCDWQGFTR